MKRITLQPLTFCFGMRIFSKLEYFNYFIEILSWVLWGGGSGGTSDDCNHDAGEGIRCNIPGQKNQEYRICDDWVSILGFDFFCNLSYNVFIKTAGKGGEGSPSWRISKSKSPILYHRSRATYLFFRFRIATMSPANVSRIMNSSYVLISAPSFQDSGRESWPLYRLPW